EVDADGQARFPANRRLCRVRADDDPPTHQSRSQACRGAGREARPTEDRRRDRAEGSKAAREGCGYFEGGQVAWHRDWHGAAHLRRASDESARGGAMSKGEQPQALGQSLQKSFATRWAPVGGTFALGMSLMPPLPKTCPKMVSAPQKGVAFLTEDVFEKNFQLRERIPLSAPARRAAAAIEIRGNHPNGCDECLAQSNKSSTGGDATKKR